MMIALIKLMIFGQVNKNVSEPVKSVNFSVETGSRPPASTHEVEDIPPPPPSKLILDASAHSCGAFAPLLLLYITLILFLFVLK